MVFGWLTERRRNKLLETPFPEDWPRILAANVVAYPMLDTEEQDRLPELVQVFVAEKHWEGCGGLELDDEIRVTIAAHASLLMLRGEPHYYPRLTSILVYPSTFLVARKERQGPFTTEGEAALLGESWRAGVVMLAWDAALRSARDARDGANVILHEFAHQLDSEDGGSDGTPYLDGRSQYAAWARAMAPGYERLRARPEGSLLGEYAATHPAEFFAVATEVFFERPADMRLRHPEIYAELSRYYGLDPVQERPASASG